jgi:hypothetical protein
MDDLFDEPTVSEPYRRGGNEYDEDNNNYEDGRYSLVPRLPSTLI